MELSQLQYFQVLARVEHFTRAAEELNITQPTLSKAISNLEAELGTRLFDRDGKQIRLNPFGRALWERTEVILTQAEEAKAMIHDMVQGIHGELRLGASFPVTPPNPVYTYLYEFFGMFPEISQHLFLWDMLDIEKKLIERKLDFGFSLTASSALGISCAPLFSDKLGIIVGPNHRLAGRKAARLEELQEEYFFCNSSALDPRDSARYLCRLAGYEPKIRYEGESSELIGEAVVYGRGVSFVSERRYNAYRRQEGRPEWENSLQLLSIENEFCRRTIYLLMLAGRYRTAAAQKFHDGLLEFCNDLKNLK
ncbi:MAG: LysR family transcriptional regulator [Oscillospiraceae bacterium]|nr:LysR family transcriptional regulator [Oscillospiraceae bacterium]